ncbi:MAG: tRNA (N(6)-L-threonylcarbamoyladenosine(37)-C(2))-methylthiotransferase MtaB [Patescibacteria group bacterium]|nr:tRNA (N(6)-L-threonylcarbamoyladenosine(37)-C(2))-methylthiotransferase MtaB [Patescibacteria group bacterium]
MRISFITLGCKLNQAETNEIVEELRRLGHVCVPFGGKTDVALIRACAVTMNASKAAREAIRRAKKLGAYVIAGGCLENRDLPEIDYVALTAGDILKRVTVIANRQLAVKQSHGIATSSASRAPRDDMTRTRAMIKIQDGCNFNCAYCVIPSFRGRATSVPIKNIIAKIKQAAKKGFKEIILTGVNICQYRNGKIDLAELLKTILTETKIERVRLGSLDPRLITNKLIGQFTNHRLMPHWHLSLQSGSDSVLKRMNRGYDTKKYLSIIKKLRQADPLFSFTTDIIAGFPGETEKEFGETLTFVKKAGFAKVHVFPYSRRPNTPAAAMTSVHDKTKTERVARLIKTADATAEKFAKKFIGQTRSVLFESRRGGPWFGYTPEYIPIYFRSAKNLKNKIVGVKITKRIMDLPTGRQVPAGVYPRESGGGNDKEKK